MNDLFIHLFLHLLQLQQSLMKLFIHQLGQTARGKLSLLLNPFKSSFQLFHSMIRRLIPLDVNLKVFHLLIYYLLLPLLLLLDFRELLSPVVGCLKIVSPGLFNIGFLIINQLAQSCNLNTSQNKFHQKLILLLSQATKIHLDFLNLVFL